jgi:HTH-type transcriptional regulator, sugar sensing transcriptional regulator
MTTTTDQAAREALQKLGFTEIEALVYTYLARSEPATGYRISHAIGKPTANTYKAIAGLVQRGAVQVDEGGNRLVRAVPPDELLAALARRDEESRRTARAALASLARDDDDDRVYTLRDRDQVLERARAMLGRATTIVLGDVFPAPLAALASELEGAAARGARVVVKGYDPADLPGVTVVPADDGAHALAAWPGQQLSLVVDAQEHLLALFDRELLHVRQAVYSRSAFLSCLHHNHVAMELLVTAGRPAAGPLADISLLSSNPPGLERLRSTVKGDSR